MKILITIAVAALLIVVARADTANAGEGTTTVQVVQSVACEMEASMVVGASATFTIGPSNCNVPLGPISFSTYFLPGGETRPFAAQTPHAHAGGNGGYYGAGTYSLAASVQGLCNWQSDLYRGSNQPTAPHVHFIHGAGIGWDSSTGNNCETQPPTPPQSPTTISQVPLPADTGHGVFAPAAAPALDQSVTITQRTPAPSQAAPSIETSARTTQSWAVAAIALAGIAFLLLGLRKRLGSS